MKSKYKVRKLNHIVFVIVLTFNDIDYVFPNVLIACTNVFKSHAASAANVAYTQCDPNRY